MLLALLYLIPAAVAMSNDGVASNTTAAYKEDLLKIMEAAACNNAWIGVPSSVKSAAEICAQRTDIASFACFLTCCYRGFGMVSRQTDEMDLVRADELTKDAFSSNIPQWENSYLTLTKNRLLCSRSGMKKGGVTFAPRFNDAEACEESKDFFKCEMTALTCDNRKYEGNITMLLKS